MQHGIDLIEGEPVFHLFSVSCEDRADKVLIESDHLPVDPAVIGLRQMQRRLIMGDRHQRLYAIPQAFVKQVVVKLKPLFVGLLFVPLRENAAPRDGRPKHLESHLRKQLDIFLVAVVKINPHQLHVVRSGLFGPGTYDAAGRHVLGAPSLAVLLIGPLALVGSHSSSPEEIFWKCHLLNPPFLIRFVQTRQLHVSITSSCYWL